MKEQEKTVYSMKFGELPYERLTIEECRARYAQIERSIDLAQTEQMFWEAWQEKYRLDEDMTVMRICETRHDCDINDTFYAAEQKYYDEISPKISGLESHLLDKLLSSKWKDAYKRKVGDFAFALIENAKKGFDDSVTDLVQQENEILDRYTKLTTGATVYWDGKRRLRSSMAPYLQSPDREIRHQASLAMAAAWEADRPELEEIYDELVKNRHKQAQRLGYKNFTELACVRMNRIGYGPGEVAAFRENVKKTLVQRFVEQEEERKKRIGLDHLYTYDGGLSFPNGNPVPKGGTKESIEAAREMFEQMSPQTAEFIDFLYERNLYDVEIRAGKKNGGYMTTFDKYGYPFIFANFDGTSENAYVMSHEGGHAFQGYLKRNEAIREQKWLTSETAETHAMSMEFFAWPYMELFFGDRADDYRTQHMEGALTRILYQCEQDEFQQEVYDNPDMTKQQRNELWQRLEKEYYPARDYADNKWMAEGCAWQRIPHAFYWPFYAIDYGLAQVCALQYHDWMEKDPKAAWESYLGFCRDAGKYSFPELIKRAGLKPLF